MCYCENKISIGVLKGFSYTVGWYFKVTMPGKFVPGSIHRRPSLRVHPITSSWHHSTEIFQRNLQCYIGLFVFNFIILQRAKQSFYV